MTGSTTRAIAFCLVLAAFPAAAQNAGIGQNSLVVGAAISQTGAHADLAADYARGLELWRDQVNASGGLLGRPVELRVLDDGSEAPRAGAAYAQLIKEKAEVLVGPYGTAATLLAAAEAESAQRVMVNGAGWSRAAHKRGPRFVFQSAIPYAAYGLPILELARSEGIRNVVILGRDDPASVEMANAAVEAAAKLGITTGDVQIYPGATTDFLPFATKARAGGAEAWIAFGALRDAFEMIRMFKKLQYAPKIVFVREAADAKLLELMGQDAEAVMGALAFQPRRAGGDAFVKAFQEKWGHAPGAAAAEGFTAGAVLAEGVRRAKSTEPRALRAALASLEMPTLLGGYKVDAATGEQVAAQPLVLQVQLGRREVVAPPAFAAAKAVVPYPAWADRRVLK